MRTMTTRMAVAGSLAASVGLAIPIAVAGGAASADTCLTVVCWFLVVAGILGTTLASRGIGWGWLLLVSLQPLWIAYAMLTDQYGFAISALAYGAGQLNGFLRSRDSAVGR